MTLEPHGDSLTLPRLVAALGAIVGAAFGEAGSNPIEPGPPCGHERHKYKPD